MTNPVTAIGNEAKVVIGDIETGASDALHWLQGEEQKIVKVAPQVVAALGVLAAGAAKLFTDATTQPFSAQELADLKAEWSNFTAFLKTVGVTI